MRHVPGYLANRTRLVRCVKVVDPIVNLASPTDKIRQIGGVTAVDSNLHAVPMASGPCRIEEGGRYVCSYPSRIG